MLVHAGKHLVNEFITPQYKDSVQEVFTKALAGAETANFEFPLMTKGRWRRGLTCLL